MKVSRISVLLPFVFAMGFSLFSAPAHAQATRTWISGVGDDANPCSRTAPCKTFAGAISKTAAGGEIDVLDPGGFGALTITKSITLDGGGGQVASVLVAGTNGFNISAQSTDIVTIKNLRIQGLRCATAGCTGSPGLTAIQFNSGAALVVDNLEIYGFANQGINFTPNQAAASTLSVQDTLISNCVGGGVVVAPTGGGTVGAAITRSRVYNSLFGFKAQDNAKLNISFSVAANNTNNGYVAASTSAAVELNLANSVASNNGIFGVSASGANAQVHMAYTSVLDNGTGISATGGGTVFGTSPGTNENAGNGTPGAPNGTAVTLQ